MRVLFFGTYDADTHPRVAVLCDGLREALEQAEGRGPGSQIDVVDECNAPLGLSTAARLSMLRAPWQLPRLAVRLASCWATLVRRARRRPRPDAVVVGYLGHFDVLLARQLFPGSTIVLDHLIGASDTARDRGVSGRLRQRLLRALDERALSAADVVVVDTDEHRDALPPAHRDRAVVVAVGAPAGWFAPAPADAAHGAAAGGAATDGRAADLAAAGDDPAILRRLPGLNRRVASRSTPAAEAPLRVVFFGHYTPLQGTPVIGAALAQLADDAQPIEVTMIGSGQNLAETRRLAAGNRHVTWLDWVHPGELPALVAEHDVCLGIFGTGPKARRVVPNKVFQGAASGTAIITSDTPPQRRVLSEAAVFVPPGDATALADALRRLATHPGDLAAARAAAHRLALEEFAPDRVVAPLVARLRAGALPAGRI